MAGFQRLASMEYSDDEILDRKAKMEEGWSPPLHPMGLSFRICEALFSALGLDDDDADVGETVRFAAFARVTATSYGESVATLGEPGPSTCRIELEIDYLALGEGKMAEIPDTDAMRPCLCLTEAECEKLDLDDDCERGDMLHIVGTARVTGSEDSPFMGKAIQLQIVEMAVEDEDEEAEGGEEGEE